MSTAQKTPGPHQYLPQFGTRESTHALDVDGTTLHYWEYSASAGAAGADRVEPTTIVLVHGFRGEHHGLARVVEAMPQYRFLAPDLPGFGSSPAYPDREHTVAAYAQTIAAFCDAMGLDHHQVLLGHSFGSIVASHLAAGLPDRFAALILVNPIAVPALEGPKGVLTKLAQFYYWACARLPERAGQALLRSPAIVQIMSVSMAKTRDPELLRFIHGQHQAYFSDFASRDMLLESFRASIAGTVAQVASQLELPTLLIAGSRDEIAPPSAQRRMLPQLPDARLEVIDGVGHLIHYETPEVAAAAISGFLREVLVQKGPAA
ncbi:alpha/beta fold hydrolase [Psychromicrobium xiongbiense]|uniref:alpha/beta fold hydrolase n=1 Tax=Psychromicrobium xiongbiense TaxID=3051184 RepID=UPI00255419BD|nr:alpha/beta hydrolase [Psychromicrobium sp. YIM S02556]